MSRPIANLARAAAGALPLVPRGVVGLDDVAVDRAAVAEYSSVTGLRYGDHVALTYPFVLGFPAVMSLLTAFDFPFPAMGAVHVANVITARRPIAVTGTVSVRVRAGNLREHRRGLLADLVSEVGVGNETAWHQVSTFLHQQRTSLSEEPAPEPPRRQRLPAPNAVLSVTPARIRRYAAVSGDRNPIHTNGLAARFFGFPGVIAHGMFSAAAALANIECRLPAAVRYSVRFAKPVVLPARPAVYLDRVAGGWDIALRHPGTGHPHLTATVRAAD